MPTARVLLLAAVLPIFAACSVFTKTPPAATNAGLVRLQGTLTAADGQLIFTSCQAQKRYVISDDGKTGVLQEASALAAKPGKIFADLRGRPSVNSKRLGGDEQLDMQTLYRIERSASACNDANFAHLLMHASGPANAGTATNKSPAPAWALNVQGKGLVLERPGQAPLAVPYLVEQLPDGRFSISTEANGQRLELWVAPQRCVDPSNGAVTHLRTELRINGVAQMGCGYYGALRSD